MDAYINAKNGNALAQFFLLPISKSTFNSTVPLTFNHHSSIKPYDEILPNQAQIKKDLAKSSPNYPELYKAQEAILQTFLRSFGFSETNWEVPVLKVICHNCWLLSKRCGLLEDCARVLSKAFTTTITDRSPLDSSKKWGTVFVVNLLLKIYFKVI